MRLLKGSGLCRAALMDEPMKDEPASRSNAWQAFTAIVIALPALYVLSSGPAQCIEQTDAGSFTIGNIIGPTSIPIKQGAWTSNWDSPFREIYEPLWWVRWNTGVGEALDWYWNAFGMHVHYDNERSLIEHRKRMARAEK